VSKKARRLFADHMRDQGERRSSAAYISNPEEIRDQLSARAWRELDAGWSVIVRLDPWIFGHWLGYDAHLLAESGQV
jgi:hypothetical protein